MSSEHDVFGSKPSRAGRLHLPFNMQSAGAAPSPAVGVPCPTIVKSQDEVVERVCPKQEEVLSALMTLLMSLRWPTY